MESESKVIRREKCRKRLATSSVKSAASVSVDGHGLTMTSCKQSTFILFILSWIDVSEAGCHNYFTDTGLEYLREPVDYVHLPNKNDSIRCTLQINSIPDEENDTFKSILQQCYKEEKKHNNTMCREHTIYKISYYHFMCWTASALNVQSSGMITKIITKAEY
ncbi:hypothetical protein D5F01_LYC19043 [Larimichthys crocea]|uniref:Uncharacterized protein n=1 Tax=Larimichthys crocea TaxID=215358 RepID=A0A6G0HWT1_LARCR|nr:hypothetical protein D5F01_LYC19043 [Larimichthys crocea]